MRNRGDPSRHDLKWLLVVMTAMLHWPVSPAGIESFDALLFWIAPGTSSICVALVRLTVSAFVPLA